MAFGALLSGMNGRTRDALQDANATSLWPHPHTLALPSHNPTAQAGHEEGFREIITVKCTYILPMADVQEVYFPVTSHFCPMYVHSTFGVD